MQRPAPAAPRLPCQVLRRAAVPCRLGAHLLLPDALGPQDHLQELGGEVAVQVAAAAEPVHEREDELRVLHHGQVLV